MYSLFSLRLFLTILLLTHLTLAGYDADLRATPITNSNIQTLAPPWYDSPSEVAAYIAYHDLLNTSPQALRRIIRLLKFHPDYRIVLAEARRGLPTTSEEQDRYLFMHFASWADNLDGKLRGSPYRCETCRYVEFPYNPALDVAATPKVTAPDKKNLLKFFRERWISISTSEDNRQRSIDLAWILALVGDVHQPLQVTSLFNSEFPEGDNHGFRFSIYPINNRKKNLHEYWEDLAIRNRGQLTSVKSAAIMIYSNWPRDRLTELKEGEPARQPMDMFDNWAHESFNIAATSVYKDGSFVIRRNAPLSRAYQVRAETLAQRRLALAGHRLAGLLRYVFDRNTDPIDLVDDAGVIPRVVERVEEPREGLAPSLRTFDRLTTGGQQAVLLEYGPLFPKSFRMGDYSIRAFAKAGWPVVVDFGIEDNSTLTISFEVGTQTLFKTMVASDSIKGPAKSLNLIQEEQLAPSVMVKRGSATFLLPETLGQQTRVAKISFRTIKNGTSNEIAYFRIHGLSVGFAPKAANAFIAAERSHHWDVRYQQSLLPQIDFRSGTIIDHLIFGPLVIKTTLGQKFTYRFHSKSDLGRLSAIFYKDYIARDGTWASRQTHLRRLGAIRREEWSPSFDWDGRGVNRGVTTGTYQLQLRGWKGAVADGFWVTCSPNEALLVND